MPKPIIDWKGKSRKFSFMCTVCGKKLRTKKEAQTCEWADVNGISRKAAKIHKRRKERQNENYINDKSERRSGEDNDVNQYGSITGECIREESLADR